MQSQVNSLHLPDTIKIHYAGAEVMNQFVACKELGINYALYTAFPFVERMVFPKGKAPILPLKWMTNPAIDIPVHIAQSCRHTIQDSGLFTLLFGSRKDIDKDYNLISRWYDALIQFTLDHGQPVTCVEVDCQNIIGLERTWEFRERMRRDLPNNRIINVYHLKDGEKELDRLIEFSDYIAISVPEFIANGKRDYVTKLTHYIKAKKRTIDIHLLGCTATRLLKENTFAPHATQQPTSSPRGTVFSVAGTSATSTQKRLRLILGRSISTRFLSTTTSRTPELSSSPSNTTAGSTKRPVAIKTTQFQSYNHHEEIINHPIRRNGLCNPPPQPGKGHRPRRYFRVWEQPQRPRD